MLILIIQKFKNPFLIHHLLIWWVKTYCNKSFQINGFNLDSPLHCIAWSKKVIMTAYRVNSNGVHVMSALFTAVININLTLMKKKCTETTAVNHLVIVAKHWCYLYEMGEEGTDTPRKSFQSYPWMKIMMLCSKQRLIRNDLFLGRGAIMSSWRKEKMYNALSPLFILRMRGGPVSVGHTSGGHGFVLLCVCLSLLYKHSCICAWM